MESPINHRCKWTIEELETLLNEVNRNRNRNRNEIDFQIIANNHKRTIGAIKYKLYRYSIQLVKNNKNITFNDLTKITSLNEEELIEGFKKLNFDYSIISKKIEDNTNNKLLYFSIFIISISQLGLLYLYLSKFSY